MQQPMSHYLTQLTWAFNSYLINVNDPAKAVKEELLAIHPKTIARKKTIAKLRKQDPTCKTIWLEQRIPLPFKCCHIFSTANDDSIFNGKKFVYYHDESVWAHVELVKDTGDNYAFDEEAPDVKIGGIPQTPAKEGPNGILSHINTPPRQQQPHAPPSSPPTQPPPAAAASGAMDDDDLSANM